MRRDVAGVGRSSGPYGSSVWSATRKKPGMMTSDCTVVPERLHEAPAGHGLRPVSVTTDPDVPAEDRDLWAEAHFRANASEPRCTALEKQESFFSFSF